MDLKEHASRELRLAGATALDVGFAHVMQLIDTIVDQQHPDAQSMNLIASMFYRLATYGTLTPLQGTDEEWHQTSPTVWVNRRCPRVFKELGVGCYDSMGVVFVTDDDVMFTKQPQSRRKVAFPYEPKTEYVRVKQRASGIVLPPGATKQ